MLTQNTKHFKHLTTMNQTIETFVQTRMLVDSTKSVDTSAVVNAYVTFNGGSTAGKIKLYAHIQNMIGVSKVRQTFLGITLIQEVEPQATVVEPPVIMVEPPATIIEPQATPVAADDGLTAYQRAMLIIEQERTAIKAQKVAIEAATAKEIEAQKAATAKEIAEMQTQTKKDIENMRNASKQEMKHIDIQEKEKDRAFIREENNKNRQMYVETRFNRFVDPRIYGTPAKQYIEQESFNQMVGFQSFLDTPAFDVDIHNVINGEVKSAAVDVPVFKKGTTELMSVIDVADVPQIFERIEERTGSKINMNLKSKIEDIPRMAVSDVRHIKNEYTRKQEHQAMVSIKGNTAMKPRDAYMREINRPYYKGTKRMVVCACCRKHIEMETAACHRAHDIPKSDGGSYSKENIYLTCADCNLAMGDVMSVVDYQSVLYGNIIDSYLEEQSNADTYTDSEAELDAEMIKTDAF